MSCPGCGAIHGMQPKPAPPEVQAAMCTACSLDFAVTVVNPDLASIVSRLRMTIFLAVLRAEVFSTVARRAGLDDPPWT